MTPEQLDEIEKLAEVATPGPWGSLTFCLDGRVFTAEEFATNQDFLRVMRTFALPLVKALREAWAKNDAAHEVIQLIVEGDALKPEAYEPWGDEESIYDACKRIVDEWRLP